MATQSCYNYIRAGEIGGTLYIGVTNDLIRRVAEHKSKLVEGFTEGYDVVRLVYFEQFDDPENANQAGEALEEVESSLENSID